MQVEAILLGASGDDAFVNHLAVDRIDGEHCVEGKVGGNHQVVGGRVGVAESSAVDSVLVDAEVVGMDIVDHSVTMVEGIGTASARGLGGGKRVETV